MAFAKLYNALCKNCKTNLVGKVKARQRIELHDVCVSCKPKVKERLIKIQRILK